MTHSRHTVRTWSLLAFCCASLLYCVSSAAASTVDRNYLLGDNSALSTENGVAGGVVGTGAGSDHPGFTLDHAGTLAALPTFQDLEPFGAPTHANVGATGGGFARPGAAAGSLGVTFDGVDDHLRGLGFGNPGDGDAPYQETISYGGLFTRAVQGWVRPTSPSLAGERQRIVRDTQRFGVSIVADAQGVNTWALNLEGLAPAQEVVSPTTVSFNQWTHMMHFANGAYAALYVNGVAVAAKSGGYSGNGGTASDQAFALGADVFGDAPTVTAGNFFTGQMDDFQVLVSGNNSTQPAGSNYGPFNLAVDNQFVAALSLVAGDATGDGLITGNGSGGANDDVKKFIDNFRFRNTVNGVQVGDLTTRTQRADLNADGITNLRDWYILVSEHEDAASLDLAVLLGGAVPEPNSLALLLFAGASIAAVRRRR